MIAVAIAFSVDAASRVMVTSQWIEKYSELYQADRRQYRAWLEMRCQHGLTPLEEN